MQERIAIRYCNNLYPLLTWILNCLFGVIAYFLHDRLIYYNTVLVEKYVYRIYILSQKLSPPVNSFLDNGTREKTSFWGF